MDFLLEKEGGWRDGLPRSKVLLVLLALELDERGEEEDHVAALVHDGAVAEGAADFAGQLVLGGFRGRVVPLEVVVAVLEVDVFFVEDGGPLERSSWIGWLVSGFLCMHVWSRDLVGRRHTMLGLASSAMAQLAVQWLCSAKLVLDLATMASSLVASLKVVVGVVELVGRLGLPVVETGLLLLLLLFGGHGGVCASGCSGSLVGAVWCYWS